MRWRRKRVDLAERLRPYVDIAPRMEPMVDADPIRMFLFRWMIETGDPIEVVARGFNVDVNLMREVGLRRVAALPAQVAAELCDKLGVADRCETTARFINPEEPTE